MCPQPERGDGGGRRRRVPLVGSHMGRFIATMNADLCVEGAGVGVGVVGETQRAGPGRARLPRGRANHGGL